MNRDTDIHFNIIQIITFHEKADNETTKNPKYFFHREQKSNFQQIEKQFRGNYHIQ